MGPQRAAAGTLLLTGIVYYSWPTPEFNHNVGADHVLGRLRLGAVARGGAASHCGWWMLLGALRRGRPLRQAEHRAAVPGGGRLGRGGRARAPLACDARSLDRACRDCAAAAPLGVVAGRDRFRPAADMRPSASTGAEPEGVHIFVLSAIAALAGMLAILAVGGLIGLAPDAGGRAAGRPAADRSARASLPRRARSPIPPLLLVVVAAADPDAASGRRGRSSMFNLVGLLAVALAVAPVRRAGAEAHRRRCAHARDRHPGRLWHRHRRSGARRQAAAARAVAGSEIAERMAGIWDRSTQGAPLRIVAGENWIAGLVGLRHKDRPHLLSNANMLHSPWISPRQLEAEGMLVRLGRREGPDRPAALHQRAHRSCGSWRYSDRRAPGGTSGSATSSCRRSARRADCALAFGPAAAITTDWPCSWIKSGYPAADVQRSGYPERRGA